MMTRKPFIFLLATIFFAVAAGLIYHAAAPENTLATENVKIRKDSDGIWRIQDNNGNNKGVMRVQRNDRIFWQPIGSKVEFRFSKNINNYFNYEEGMFKDGHNQIIENNDMLRVTLKETAPKDTVVYNVYVFVDDTLAVGNSPPVMIVY